jgi:hypothetical protein
MLTFFSILSFFLSLSLSRLPPIISYCYGRSSLFLFLSDKGQISLPPIRRTNPRRRKEKEEENQEEGYVFASSDAQRRETSFKHRILIAPYIRSYGSNVQLTVECVYLEQRKKLLSTCFLGHKFSYTMVAHIYNLIVC